MEPAAQGDFLEDGGKRLAQAEAAIDHIRARFGSGAVIRGRALREDGTDND
jgi:hypothetical protein